MRKRYDMWAEKDGPAPNPLLSPLHPGLGAGPINGRRRVIRPSRRASWCSDVASSRLRRRATYASNAGRGVL
jgi:hypothetical protein